MLGDSVYLARSISPLLHYIPHDSDLVFTRWKWVASIV